MRQACMLALLSATLASAGARYADSSSADALSGSFRTDAAAARPSKPWPYSPALRVDAWLAHVLLYMIGPNATLLDVGASHGAYGVFFHNCNPDFRLRQYTGIDGMPNVETWTSPPYAPPGAYVRRIELCNPLPPGSLAVHDWVMSLEVGEHIPAKCISGYLANLDRHASKGIILSWSTSSLFSNRPNGHISARSNQQVEDMMAFLGYTALREESDILRRHANEWYYRQNVRVFRRLRGRKAPSSTTSTTSTAAAQAPTGAVNTSCARPCKPISSRPLRYASPWNQCGCLQTHCPLDHLQHNLW